MLIYKDGKSGYENENIKREREKNLKDMLNNQFFKPFIVSIDDMGSFDKK